MIMILGKEQEVEYMENGGNAKVNAIFESRLAQSGATKPTTIADGHTRERFIRDKYERRKYYDEAAYHTAAASTSAAVAVAVESHNRDISLPAMNPGPPSDAARQRMEERRGRMKKSGSNVSTESSEGTNVRPKRSVKKTSGAGRKSPAVGKAPASAPPPSMDLLDMSEPEQQPTHALASEHAQSFQDTKAEMFDFLNSNTSTNHVDSMGTTDSVTPSGGGGGSGLMGAPNATKPASLDIMSLYNTGGSVPQQQQQQAFNTNSNNPLGNHMSGLMQQMSINNQQSGNHNNNNGMMNNQQQPNMMNMNYPQQQQQMYQQQMMMQQQQQQRQMMMNQQGQQQQQGNQGGGMMNQQGNHGGGMMNNNNNMMNMQQQNNGGGGGFGQPMGSGPPVSSMQSNNSKRKEPKQPEKQDPFADFGMNAFR
jgi:hypothetical protein